MSKKKSIEVKLFSPEFPDNSRLLMRIVKDMKSSTLFAALRAIY